jgi:hypothetical protein
MFTRMEKIMKKNIGKLDTYTRFIIGMMIVLLATIFTSWILFAFAGYMLITSFVGISVIYSIFKFDTLKFGINKK